MARAEEGGIWSVQVSICARVYRVYRRCLHGLELIDLEQEGLAGWCLARDLG